MDSNQVGPVLLNNWAGMSGTEVLQSFDGTRWSHYREDDATTVEDKPKFAGVELLLASYGTPEYEGYAFVLFRREGKLFEVNGAHCSCYGLEGQWEPEETSIAALLHRLDHGKLGDGSYDENPFAPELRALLAKLFAEGQQ